MPVFVNRECTIELLTSSNKQHKQKPALLSNNLQVMLYSEWLLNIQFVIPSGIVTFGFFYGLEEANQSIWSYMYPDGKSFLTPS
jgi:hypothetical protein